MQIRYVKFRGRSYKLRLIDFRPEWGRHFVGSTQLDKLLYNDECDYTSDDVSTADEIEAQAVDEMIFYFIPTHYFKLSDVRLREKILDELV